MQESANENEEEDVDEALREAARKVSINGADHR
jgi:hypothetical protein